MKKALKTHEMEFNTIAFGARKGSRSTGNTIDADNSFMFS
jgi:hypothetical protein